MEQTAVQALAVLHPGSFENEGWQTEALNPSLHVFGCWPLHSYSTIRQTLVTEISKRIQSPPF